jgi:inorganic pyrophosphatase
MTSAENAEFSQNNRGGTCKRAHQGLDFGTDEGGGDEKIIAVPISKLTQRYAHVRNYTESAGNYVAPDHFFSHYKDLEAGKWIAFAGWGDASDAKRLITEAIDRQKGQVAK